MEINIKMSADTDEIQIANVHEELAKLSSEGKKRNLIKGCLFNLIIYSQNPKRSIFLKEIVQTVTETFPCRIIFIENDLESKKQFLKVSVDEEIIKKQKLTVSCDKINISCTSNYLKRVPFIILPHFVPDLPIFLLWGQDPSQENEILPYLQTFATRLIFDSDNACDLREFCHKMLSDPKLKKISVTDMNWASLTSWREILYHIFDSSEKIEQLKTCKQINIHYNNKKSEIHQYTSRRALYLQGWLAAQLDWQYQQSSFENHTIVNVYKHKQGLVKVIISGEEIKDLIPGAIVKTEILTNDNILYDLSRPDMQSFIKVHISKKETCDLPVILPLRHSKKGLLFMNEIFFASCSPHYWKMLKAIEDIRVPC